jgi:serine/threonine protein kinase
MDTIERERIRALFHDALARSPADRVAFLERACRDEPSVHAEVETLLAAHGGAGQFLKDPTVDVASLTAAVEAAQESQVAGAFAPGMRVGPYKLLEEIGEGGFGIVYLAEQEEPVRRRVALKIVKLGMDTREVIARFEAERQALALMDHANIAKVFDAGATESGRPYFVMELVRGVPITEYADLNGLAANERLRLFTMVCSAVQHAHQKGVIHRDLKPSNILVTLEDGRPVPKVIDFGIAKATFGRLTEKTIYTRFRQLIGTPAYMSPEQAEMSSLDVDTRSDVYSLGVLLYELLTGTTPFDARGLVEAGYGEIRRIIREVEPPKPSTRVSTMDDAGRTAVAQRRGVEPRSLARLLRGDLDWIIMRALEKDRARRYGTAADLARDVERHLKNEPVEAGPPGGWYRFSKLVRRNRAAFVTSGLVLAALMAGFAVAVWGVLEAWDEAAKAKAAEDRERVTSGLEKEARIRAQEAKTAAEAQRTIAERRAAEARREAEKAKRVVGILDKVFEAADPREGPVQDLTVRQLLDRFASRLDEGLEKEPIVEATVRRTLGQAYLNLGRLVEAELHLQRSLELAQAALGEDDELTLSARAGLAGVRLQQGDHEDAIRLYTDAWERSKRVLGERHFDTRAWRNNLGLALQASGKDLEAEAILAPLLEELRAEGKGRDRSSLAIQCGLALVRKGLGQLDDAEKLYRDALEGYEAAVGPEHLDTLTCKVNLADVCRATSRVDEAKSLLTEVLEAALETLGGEHPIVADALQRLGEIHFDRIENVQAETMLSRALAVRRAAFGDTHPQTMDTLHYVASVESRLGKLEEAAKHLGEVHVWRKKNLGDGHERTVACAINLGAVQLQLGQLDEAADAFEQALAQSSHAGDEDLQILGAIHNLAMVRWKQKRPEEAAALIKRADLGFQRASGSKQPDLIYFLGNAASFYIDQGRHAEAEQFIVEGLKVMKDYPVGDPRLAQGYRQMLVKVYQKLERLQDIEPVLREAVDDAHARRDLKGLLERGGALADFLERMDREVEAVPIIEEQVEVLRKARGPAGPDTLSAMNRLATLYAGHGREEDGVKLLTDVIPLSRDAFGAEHNNTLIAIANLARFHLKAKRPEAARPLIAQVIEARLKAPAVDPDELYQCLGDLARLLEEKGQIGDARTFTQKLVGVAREHFPGDPERIARALAFDGDLLTQLGQVADAGAALREALELRAKLYEAADWRVANIESLLGAALAAQGKHAEAEPLVIGGAEKLLKAPGATSRHRRRAIERAVEFLEKRGERTKAEEWRQMLASLPTESR